MWGLILRRRWPDCPGIILAGLLLVAMNPYFLSWNVTVKTYALTNLSVFAAFWALTIGLKSRLWSWFLLAGAFAGLGVGVRLLYLPWAGMLGLTVGWLGLRGLNKELRLGNMFAYFGGLLAGLLPSAAIPVRDPIASSSTTSGTTSSGSGSPRSGRNGRHASTLAGAPGCGQGPVPESVHGFPAGPGRDSESTGPDAIPTARCARC